MPNGVMTGDGTAENPYIVMDGYDFNVLRDISSSTSAFAYVEIGADISLDMYGSFTPVPKCYMNIKGNNHSITGFYTAGTNAGLFTELHTTSITDLVLDGESTASGSYNTAGLLAAKIVGRGATISNVQAFGVVTGSNIGGLAAIVVEDSYSSSSVTGATTSLLNCAFQGILNFTPANVSSSISGTTPYCGGLVGRMEVTGYRNNYIIKNCLVKTNIILANNGGINFVGGIFGTSYYGGAAYTTSIIECVAETIFIINGTVSTSNIIRFGGLASYFVRYQNDSQINNFVSLNNAAHSKIVLNGAHSLVAGGLINAPSSTSVAARVSFTTTYAVIQVQTNDYNLDNVHIDGISRSPGYVLNNTFWDREALEATYTKYTGEYIYPGADTTTANLKSSEFLAAQGWDI